MAPQKPHSKEEKNKTPEEEEEEEESVPLLLRGVKERERNSVKKLIHPEIELTRRPSHFSSSSEESAAAATSGSTTTPPLTDLPSCSSSSSSSFFHIITPNPYFDEEEDIIDKLKSSLVFEQEQAVISLRTITRTREDSRVHLCTHRLLLALRSMITPSRYATVKVNALAALVNLSLPDQNKVKIMRSGIVRPLIDVLKEGFAETQDQAAAALFSLALNDENKPAIGFLGALKPLLHTLRSDSERARHDSAHALFHLSLFQGNRTKLVKLGAVTLLLGMVRSGHVTGQVLLVLCNLAMCEEGRAAMLDHGAVGCFVGILARDGLDTESTRDNCVAALYGLSQGGMRFNGLAKEAGLEKVLKRVEQTGSERVKEKARQILETLKGRRGGELRSIIQLGKGDELVGSTRP